MTNQRKVNSRQRLVLLVFAIIVSLCLCAAALSQGWVHPEKIRALVIASGPAASVAYVAVVVLMEVLWLPRMSGLILGGLLFGPLWGGALSILADLIAATLCYFFAKSVGQQLIVEALARRPKAARVSELLVKRRGLFTVAVLRVCPVAHYTLVSYAAGLAGVSQRSFIFGTAIGILPGAALYPLLGHSALTPTSPLFISSLLVVALFSWITLIAVKRMLKKQT